MSSPIVLNILLTSGDGDEVVDILDRATAREVVHRTGDTLQDRTNSSSTSQTLNQLIGDVTYLQTRHHQHVGLTSNLTTRSLLRTYRGNEGSISLQLTVDLQAGVELLSQLRSLTTLSTTS